jgi:hypothetical protein
MKQLSCDVLVIGGGVAGTAAAVAAARSGVRAVLVEKEPYLGGTAYAGMFQYICGLYLNGATFPTETLNGGLAREILAQLVRGSPELTASKIGQVYVHAYTAGKLQAVLCALCAAERNLSVLRTSVATAVETAAGAIGAVCLDGPAGTQTIHAAMVIDCSGDGVVAAMAGAQFALASPEELQLAGYVVHLQGLKNLRDTLSLEVPYHLALGVRQGKLPPLLKYTTFSRAAAPGEGYCKMSLNGEDGGVREERAKTDAAAMLAYLSGALPSFKDATIAGASLKVLDREGRRVCGAYTLGKEDILAARKFADGLVRNAWPIELWDRTRGTVYNYVPRGDYYEIPFRCLTVQGFSNLLTAGRCISVSHAALGSTRVIGTCLALGERAGQAAALHVRNGQYPENIKELLVDNKTYG